MKNTGIDYEKLVRNLYQQILSLDGIENIEVRQSVYPAKTAAVPYYLSVGEPDLTQLLAPPPDPNSPLEQYDEKKMAQILASRTDADMVRAAADAHRSVFVFGDVLSDGFTPLRVPLTTTFFDRVDSDTELLVDRAKAYCEDARVIPSGHAAFAACTAILLSQMVPEQRDAIFQRASTFAQSRLIAGVHYLSDV